MVEADVYVGLSILGRFKDAIDDQNINRPTVRLKSQPTADVTVPVASGDGPVRAEARLTKADIESAPEFRYADQSRQR